jgi:hypothetical protein
MCAAGWSSIFFSLGAFVCISFLLLIVNADFSKAIIVDNIPVADAEKAEKLKAILLKIYVQFEDTLTLEDIDMPFDSATGKSCG